MNRLLVLIFFLDVALAIGQTTTTGNIMHNGANRSYRLRLPANHNKNIPIPLVFNLHGFTSNATQQELYSGMNAVADTARFAVCYPNGISNAWNVGWTFGSTADDVGYISSLIDKLYLDYGIDKSRVYACGMSNGGFMSYRLACELNDRIAAIASVTGSMVQQALDKCSPGKAVPVMQIHGTADATVKYEGTANVSVSIPKVLEFWQKNNGCEKDPIIELLPDIKTNDNTTTEKWTYTNCTEDRKLILFKVLNGEHTWPGSAINIGNTSQDFNASVEIWKFFKQYKLKDISSSNDANDFEVNVNPNPTFDVLNIKLENPQELRIEILDAYGRSWINKIINDSDVVINVESLPAGLYFLNVDGKKIIKVVKVN